MDFEKQNKVGFEILRNEINSLYKDMAKACEQFGILGERMENVARNLRELASKVERQAFQAFIDAGMAVGNHVRFLGANQDRIFKVTGMDGCGFFLQNIEGGNEFHLDVREHFAKAKTVRLVNPTEIRKLR